jgi:S1-C subfamily serine protease
MRANRRRVLAGPSRTHKAAAWSPLLAAVVMGLWAVGVPEAIAAQGPASPPPGGGAAASPGRRSVPSPTADRLAARTGRPAARTGRAKVVLPSDDWTFRPTVVVRRGTSQGSGTIIASIDGETLVLTAAHVVQERGPITVELHRYNLGLERQPPAPGAWPRPVGAVVAASDPAADLAVLRVEKLAALPYVARLAPGFADPASDSLVTSIGIDLGTRLSSWTSRLVESLWFELNDSRDERLFFITARIPEHSRSGGGLFLPNGDLVGVCVGHAELVPGERMGVFASRESIRQLLRDNHLAAVIVRSELRQSSRNRPTPGRTASTPTSANPKNPTASPVTPTRALGPNGS